jgi:predicted membrane protein
VLLFIFQKRKPLCYLFVILLLGLWIVENLFPFARLNNTNIRIFKIFLKHKYMPHILDTNINVDIELVFVQNCLLGYTAM